MDETNLSKSLYRAVMKALGSNEGQQHAVDHIVDDIEDPNMEPNTPSDHIPAAKESVLHKDVSVSEMHQQKQAAAEAAVGMRPGQQKPAMKKMNYAAMMGMSEDAKDPGCVRGIDKLRKFMEKSSMKKAQKGVHPSVKDTRNRYRDDETKRGISEMGRQARKASLYSKGHELGQAVGPENIKRAKEIAKEKLFESKMMPKPNLPKSEEMGKAQKGVHQPHFMAGKKTGTSDVGARMMSGVKPSGVTKQHAMSEHQRILSDLKQMPKPNLPKSEEMDKAIPAPAAPPVPASAKRILSRPTAPKPAMPKPSTMMMSESASRKKK